MLFLTITAFSCEKEDMKKYEPNCRTGNCVDVNIRGTLVVKPEGTGLRNIPVVVYFYKGSRVPLFPVERKVASGKTNRNGEFDFKVTINTRSFEEHYLIVKIPEQKNYFTIHSEYGATFDMNHRIYRDYNAEDFKSINFEFYRKTNLTINLNRTQTDDIARLNVLPEFVGAYVGSGMTNFQLFEDELKTTNKLQWVTAADVYTYITWIKSLSNGERKTYSDSLICLPNVNNVFNINY